MGLKDSGLFKRNMSISDFSARDLLVAHNYVVESIKPTFFHKSALLRITDVIHIKDSIY